MTSLVDSDPAPATRTSNPWEGPTDWGFHAEEPQGALNGGVSHWCYWWNDDLKHRFTEAWGQDADELADELADSYAYMWPWFLGDLLSSRSPETAALVRSLLAADEALLERTQQTNSETVFTMSVIWGAFETVRERRTWEAPRWRDCPICGERFYGGDPPIWTYRQFGPSRYCTSCCFKARSGDDSVRRKGDVIDALTRLSSACDTIPPQAFAFLRLPLDLSPERRDAIMRGLIGMPPQERVKKVLRAPDWLAVLQTAGLVDSTWRPSRGTWCRAKDGHRCRSLLEKSIDDWLTAHGIEHECEPYWPKDEELNPNGRQRADWRLKSGAFVECAGMLEEADYRQRFERKVELAKRHGIKLYVLAPSDLMNLGKHLGAELPLA
ncbi:MAG: hypothetical protein M0000_13830 [Actinomycetota bacterium]|nr:hypothetical protein [Actinomycetota bacterium]